MKRVLRSLIAFDEGPKGLDSCLEWLDPQQDILGLLSTPVDKRIYEFCVHFHSTYGALPYIADFEDDLEVRERLRDIENSPRCTQPQCQQVIAETRDSLQRIKLWCWYKNAYPWTTGGFGQA